VVEGLPRLRPTPDQYRTFGEYLCDAHGWYKHLPLMGGRRFVVFVAPDAGIGRLVAVLQESGPETATGYSLVTPPEGPEFTDAHPRLHYGWKTTKEYRTRFGYLDYSCWPTEDGSYARDAGPAVSLPARLVEQCGFVLYPYVSQAFGKALIWRVPAEALADLRSGAAHPARDEVLELARLAEALGPAWLALGERERGWVLVRHREGEEPLTGEPSDELRRYLAIDDRIHSITESLREREADKIRGALAALDNWLLHEAEPSAAADPGRL
jgi:hypothetical protein